MTITVRFEGEAERHFPQYDDIRPLHLSHTKNGIVKTTGEWICNECVQREEEEDRRAVVRRAIGE